MNTSLRLMPVGMAALLTLAACTGMSKNEAPMADPAMTEEPAMRTGSAEDEKACELAVFKETQNPEIVTLSSDFSEANTIVMIGVGPQKAKWKCLVSKGRVAEVISMTDEGAM